MFCSISDVPENLYYISQRKDVIEQVLTVIATPRYYGNGRAITALCLLMNLAQCKEAHQNLLQPDIVEILINSVKSRKADNLPLNLPVQLLL